MHADFYLISTPQQEIYTLLCRLLQKNHLQEKSVYVYVNSFAEATQLRTFILMFNNNDFSALVNSRIQIGHIAPDFQGDILYNLTTNTPEFHQQFSRIIEIVPQEKAAREASRKKYQFYQKLNFQLATHNI